MRRLERKPDQRRRVPISRQSPKRDEHLHVPEVHGRTRWRRRAWHARTRADLPQLADQILRDYWSEALFRNLGSKCDTEQVRSFLAKFRDAFAQARSPVPVPETPAPLRKLFSMILQGQEEAAMAWLRPESREADKSSRPSRTALRVMTLVSRDSGERASDRCDVSRRCASTESTRPCTH